jgi:hypothetical protein
MPQLGRICRYDVLTKRIDATHQTDQRITDMALEARYGRHLFLTTLTGRPEKLNAVDLKSVGLGRERPDLQRVFALSNSRYALLGVESSGRAIHLIPPTFFGRGRTTTVRFYRTDDTIVTAAVRGTWLAMVEDVVRPGMQPRCVISVWPMARTLDILSAYLQTEEQMHTMGMRMSQRRALRQRADRLADALDSLAKTIDVPTDEIIRDGPVNLQLHFVSKRRLLFARRSFAVDLRGELKDEGAFEANPMRQLLRGDEAFAQALALLDSVISVSRDGQWAVSGLSVYNVAKRKIEKALPFPTFCSCFSYNGRDLFLISAETHELVHIPNWQDSELMQEPVRDE